MQDTELAKISQAGMSDISQRASWRTAKPKTAVGSAIVARVARPIIPRGRLLVARKPPVLKIEVFSTSSETGVAYDNRAKFDKCC